MGVTGYDRQMYADIHTLAENSTRIADALEQLASTKAIREANARALEEEMGRAGEIERRREREAVPECRTNRCTEPAAPGRTHCTVHAREGDSR